MIESYGVEGDEVHFIVKAFEPLISKDDKLSAQL